jgi:plastocyanin
MRTRTLWLLVGVVLVSILALGSAGALIVRMHTVSAASGITGSNQQRPAIGVTHVFIRSEAYQPSNIQVPVGTVITWTNRDNVPHTVTLAHVMQSTHDIWESGQLSPGESFSYTFMSSGTFTYYCSDHPSIMAGVVTVM